MNIFYFLLHLPWQKAMLQRWSYMTAYISNNFLFIFLIIVKNIGKLKGLRLRFNRASEGVFDHKNKNLWMHKWIMDWWKGISSIIIYFIYMLVSFILEKLNKWKGNNNQNLVILVITVVYFLIFTGLQF